MKVATTILATTIALVGTSMADDAPVVTMTMPTVDDLVDVFEFEGSVVEAGPSGTTMVITCEAKGATATTASDDYLYCQMLASATFIAGPSTYSMAAPIGESGEVIYTQHMGCDIQSATQAVCSATESYPTTITEYPRIPERTTTIDQLVEVPVTITAGADKLSAAQTVSGTEPTGTETDAEPTGTETGAAPRITGAARWAVGGMAAVALAAAA